LAQDRHDLTSCNTIYNKQHRVNVVPLQGALVAAWLCYGASYKLSLLLLLLLQL